MAESGNAFDRILIAGLFALSALEGAAVDLHGSGIKAEASVVDTEWGAIRGSSDGEVSAWKAIPYAAPPVGELRWRPPVAPEPWTGVLDATAFGPPCPQVDDDGVVIGEENCLQLNVWAPVDAGAGSRLPVLFFMHGGGNIFGSVSVAYNGRYLYDGAELARRTGGVVVTTQYRLGAFGFLVHPALDVESPHGSSGNYGLRDQIAALEWVQRNIEAFGGDPGRVLLFGESAGALDTCMLLTSPRAFGLFSAVLMQSGSCRVRSIHELSFLGLEVARTVGCDTVAGAASCLRAADAEGLVSAIGSETIKDGVVTSPLGPVLDGDVLQRSPLSTLEEGIHQSVPLVIGSNADEMLLHVPDMGPLVYELRVRGLFARFGPEVADDVLALYRVGQGEGEYETGAEAFAAVLSDAQFIEQVKQLAHGAIVQDHGVVVETLAAEALRLFGDVGAEVHVGGVPPHKEGFALGVGLFDELDGAIGDVVVDGLHALLGERAGVLDAPVGKGVDHAARAGQ